MMSTYIIETLDTSNNTHFTYREMASNAQGAVDIVSRYITSYEVIVEVSKVISGWKY